MTVQFPRSFPDELLLHIISSVEDLHTLAALSRVSHHFHDITEPHLYSSFEQDEVSGAAMPLFLRTMLMRPQLCRNVKRWFGNTCNYLAIDMGPLEEFREELHFLI